jgi:uncharacterized membrane protein YdjX (TVP38/TMEM64 family)
MGSTFGATLASLASRYLLQRWVHQQAGARVQRLEKGFSRYGFHYLLALRLAPLLPSFVINFGAGLTHVSLPTYVVSTMVGILPSTIVYAAAARHLEWVDSLGDLTSPTVFWPLVGVAVIAVVPAIYGSVASHR